MPRLFVFLALVLPACAQDAQQPTLQQLLQEVHGLRIALEKSNQIAPRIQIALARMQLQQERVRDAERQLETARAKLADTQNRRSVMTGRIKELEARQLQTVDPGGRNALDQELAETKSMMETIATMEEQLRTAEAQANANLLSEQSRWNEASDLLSSLERVLSAPPQP